MFSDSLSIQDKVLMVFTITKTDELSFGDLAYLLLKKRVGTKWTDDWKPSRYPTKEKKRLYQKWREQFYHLPPEEQGRPRGKAEWLYPLRSCECSKPNLAQTLQKMCQEGYLKQSGKGPYRLSKDYVYDPIKKLDAAGLTAYPSQQVLCTHKLPHEDRYRDPVHIYGFSSKLQQYLTRNKDFRERFDDMVTAFHRAAYHIQEFKNEMALDYLRSEYATRCKSSKTKRNAVALDYAHEHPRAFTFLLESLYRLLEYNTTEELDNLSLIMLAAIEENMDEYEIDAETMDTLPEMAAIDVITDIIENNRNDIYPSLPVSMYSPISVTVEYLKQIEKKFREQE
ncbi:MAG: hypothetical protein ACP5FL_05325 [Thermoplasmatota archaeon]